MSQENRVQVACQLPTRETGRLGVTEPRTGGEARPTAAVPGCAAVEGPIPPQTILVLIPGKHDVFNQSRKRKLSRCEPAMFVGRALYLIVLLLYPYKLRDYQVCVEAHKNSKKRRPADSQEE